jgi:release factor glutamine methyltransferase
LIPRPETELLVELCLGLLDDRPSRVLDLCCGSGAIALALASERDDLQIVATDKSIEAIALAKSNAARNGLQQRIEFLATDLFSGLCPSRPGFDVIVSNPPYVGDNEIHWLAPEVREHEPLLALRGGGPDGIGTLIRILDEFQGFLKPGGTLLLEIGHKQREALTEKARLLAGSPAFEFHKDYSELTRVLRVTTHNR